jgi:mandelamide amidase
VLPRKLPGADGLVDARPVYERAIAESRPALQAHYAETFSRHAIDALVYPTCPEVACLQGSEAAAQPVFMGYIRNLDPSSNAGIPSLALPAGLGPTTGLPVGLSLDGPVGTDRRILALGMAIEQVLGRLPPPR